MAIYIVAVIAVIAGSLAWQQWRRCQSLQAVLHEGARGYETLRARTHHLEQSAPLLETRALEARKREDAVRSALAEMSARAQDAETELDLKATDFERRLRNVELQRDHMLTQHEHDSRALAAAHELIASLKSEGEQLKADVAEANSKALQKVRQENIELRKKLTDVDRDLRTLKTRPDINPRDFDTLRRKVGQYELLFNGMKSQRDMSEERNKNWESALERLSVWILTKSSLAVENDPVLTKGIGPKVGEALSRIGGSLMDLEPEDEHEAEQLALSDDSRAAPRGELEARDAALLS